MNTFISVLKDHKISTSDLWDSIKTTLLSQGHLWLTWNSSMAFRGSVHWVRDSFRYTPPGIPISSKPNPAMLLLVAVALIPTPHTPIHNSFMQQYWHFFSLEFCGTFILILDLIRGSAEEQQILSSILV